MDQAMRYFYQLFEQLPRQGPGDAHHTRKAIDSARPHLPSAPTILDIGCGSGAQTLTVAATLGGTITALDNHPPFLEQLRQQARAEQLEAHIFPCLGDLQQLPFPPASFDLIWSEGAIYLMGLTAGLRHWGTRLKSNGILVISDNLWLHRSPHPEVRAFWQEESPEMLDLSATQARIQRLGYTVLDHFTLPIPVWEESYYRPLEQGIAAMRQQYPASDPILEQTLATLEQEMRIFRLADGAYSYQYWVLTKGASGRGAGRW